MEEGHNYNKHNGSILCSGERFKDANFRDMPLAGTCSMTMKRNVVVIDNKFENFFKMFR